MAEEKLQCPRCGGKREVTCPACRGTAEERNESWVVVGPCKVCAKSKRKGFVICPKCSGTGLASPEKPVPDSKKW